MTPDPSEDQATLCARATPAAVSATQPLAPAIQLSCVYRIAGLDQIDNLYEGREAGFTYSRDGTPNAAQLESKIAVLEGADKALICSSGMGAESAVFLGCLRQGDEIALSEGLYGKTSLLVGRELSRLGIGHRVFDATRPETLGGVLNARTRVVFAETLSNPLLRVADISALAAMVKHSEAKLVIDHTMAPLLCSPIALGADAVTHSLTKLIGGHSDLLLGLVAGSNEVVDRAIAVASAYGFNGNPFESWLALRGLATLKLRSDRACSTAWDLAERLEAHPKVKAVHYPGLKSHPDHGLATSLFQGGFGTVLTINVGGRVEADRLIRSVKEIPFAPSFGDVSTTLSHPATTSHRGQSPERWAAQGISPGLIRLSIGLESADSLWNDLEQGLKAI